MGQSEGFDFQEFGEGPSLDLCRNNVTGIHLLTVYLVLPNHHIAIRSDAYLRPELTPKRWILMYNMAAA